MSNLENLTQKILEDGKLEAAKIIEESKKNNEKIINSKVIEANDKKEKIIDKANSDALMLKDRMKSEAELKVRDKKLDAKRQVLDKAFELAKKRLKNIDEVDYINFLKNNIQEIDLKGSNVLIVPEKFKEAIKGLGLYSNISETDSVESGFLIKNGNIVMNYSFESLLDFMRDDIEGEVAKTLFQE
ncbi:MAG: V-type ATP synthase subunit E [Tissierellia bacterium]|nr:V-type ATP synthase subunit E [Tissierellia bacterium]MDD4725408.1 V-type ATP synthase subunit E [Tissierellia bacterium]